MGYQESYMHTKHDFDKLVALFRKLGKAHFENRLIEPVRIITLKKEIKGNYEFMCRPEETYHFPAGTSFIYVVGERSGQRSNEVMLGSNPKGVSIIATECFPSEQIFNDPDSDCAEHKPFAWSEEKIEDGNCNDYHKGTFLFKVIRGLFHLKLN